MDVDVIIGIFVLCLAYGFIVYLNIWSRATIEKISKKKLVSLREILEYLRHGR